MEHFPQSPRDWEALVLRHETRLYRAALAILGDPQEAEDAVQDAFLAYWEKAPAFGSPEQESAWLTRVTVNRCISLLRSPWRRRTELPPDLPAPERPQELEELYRLPPGDRAVLHLYYYEGYSTREIAAMLRLRPGTVRSRLARAREKLKTLLEGDAV